MIRSKTERSELTRQALAQLKEAQRTRQNYHDLLMAAITAYGDVVGTPTSGIYNPAFPDSIKDELRTLAHNIGVQVAYAFELWRQAGRRTHTLRPYQEQARKLSNGGVSYY